MSIRLISTEQLRRMEDQEGLVLQGCGGDPQEWLDGINEILAQEGILKKGAGFQLLILSRSPVIMRAAFLFSESIPAHEKGRRRIWRYKVKNPNQTSSKSMRTVPEYRDHTGPPGFAEKPICRASPLCEDCPFPGHGFLCQGGDGECMRTRLMKLSDREEKSK